MNDAILVFDLRNGRVGGLTFCEIIESWFDREQSFMIDNDVIIAADRWNSLPAKVKGDIRFIWGHNFCDFRNRVGLERPLQVVSLARHPLLKVSGMRINRPEQLSSLDAFSIGHEFELHKAAGGPLTCASVEAFIDSHFVFGVTELMEESIALLRSKLDIEPSLNPWHRNGSVADISDNIYSHGLVGDYIKRPHYRRELYYYGYARRRLLDEVRRMGRKSRLELVQYKRKCAGRDATALKWDAAYPGVLQPPPPPTWRAHLRPLRPWRSPPPSAIHVDAGVWTIVLSVGEAEIGGKSEPLPSWYNIVEPFITFNLHHVHVAAAPNLLRVELDLPSITANSRWVYALIGDHRMFQVELGANACTQAIEIPLGPKIKTVRILINQFAQNGKEKIYARIRHVKVLHVPWRDT